MKEQFQQVLKIVPMLAGLETGKWIQKINRSDSLELWGFEQNNEYPLVINMLCLVLVLLKAIKERDGKERSAQKAPQSTLALPKQPDDELRSGGIWLSGSYFCVIQ